MATDNWNRDTDFAFGKLRDFLNMIMVIGYVPRMLPICQVLNLVRANDVRIMIICNYVAMYDVYLQA